MGSGWAALAWEPVMQRLVTVQIYDHQSNVTQGGIPLMVLDGWEHAFYLQYGPVKADYFNAIWNVWNWDDVKQRFVGVKGLNLNLRKATV
jgi:Fe-Mn family superoxide dismutase